MFKSYKKMASYLQVNMGALRQWVDEGIFPRPRLVKSSSIVGGSESVWEFDQIRWVLKVDILPEKLLTIEQVSLYTKISKRRLRHAYNTGRLPFIKLGKRVVRFDESSVDKFVRLFGDK
jgi:excisionase family DNA binding protein